MADRPTRVTGGCLCGDVRYEAEVFLDGGYYCHCTMCRRSSGAPAEFGIPIKAGTLTFTKGAPKYYMSSKIGRRGFCERCGARLLWRPNDPANDWWTSLCVGSLDDPAAARPSMHIHVDERLPWYEVTDETPRMREEDGDQVAAMMAQARGIAT